MLRGIEVGQLDGTEMDKKDASILRKYGSIDGYKKTRVGRCAKNWNLEYNFLSVSDINTAFGLSYDSSRQIIIQMV